MYVLYPLSLRQVEDLLYDRGIDICHETARIWWNRFGPMFAVKIRKPSVVSRGDECGRKFAASGVWALPQQPRRKFTPTVSPKGRGDVEIQGHREAGVGRQFGDWFALV